MGNLKYLAGPKLGDFIHSISICALNYKLKGLKADLYIANKGDAFVRTIEETWHELLPVIGCQEWVSSFEIYNNQEIDVDLTYFRQSPHIYTSCWIDLLTKTFSPDLDTPYDFKWLSFDEKDESLSDVILINRSLTRQNPEKNQIYLNTINSNHCKFICFDVNQYEYSIFKNLIEPIVCNDLHDFCIKLNSCKGYIGNQSSPSAFSTAINVPRQIELCSVDGVHYKNDEIFYKNYKTM